MRWRFQGARPRQPRRSRGPASAPAGFLWAGVRRDTIAGMPRLPRRLLAAALMAGWALACSSSHPERGDAGAESRSDAAARDRTGEHVYADAGPPGPLGAPLQGVERTGTWIDFPD